MRPKLIGECLKHFLDIDVRRYCARIVDTNKEDRWQADWSRIRKCDSRSQPTGLVCLRLALNETVFGMRQAGDEFRISQI